MKTQDVQPGDTFGAIYQVVNVAHFDTTDRHGVTRRYTRALIKYANGDTEQRIWLHDTDVTLSRPQP